jgi:hypothetical protein
MKHRKAIALIVSLCLTLTAIVGRTTLMTVAPGPDDGPKVAHMATCHEAMGSAHEQEQGTPSGPHCPKVCPHPFHACCHGFIAVLPAQFPLHLLNDGRVRVPVVVILQPILRVEDIFRPPRLNS